MSSRPLLLIFGASASVAAGIIDDSRESFVVVAVSRKPIDFPGVKQYIVSSYSETELEEVLCFAQQFNRIAIIICNGVAEKSAFYKLSLDEIAGIIEVNLNLPISLTSLFLRKFLTKRLTFLYCASSRALGGDRGIAVYSASKSALASYSRCMALEYGRFGHIFVVLSLGLFAGGLTSLVPEKSRASIMLRSAVPEYVLGADLVRAIEFCAFNRSVNGSVVKVDNGFF